GCATFFCRRAPDRAPVSPPAPEPGKSRVTPAGATVPARVKARTRRRGVKGSAGRRVGGRRRRLARGCSCLGSSGRSHNSNSSTNDSGSSLTGSSSDSPSSSGNNGPDSGGNTSTSSSTCRSNSSPRSSSHNSSNGKGPYSGSPSPSSRSHNSRSSNCLNGSSPSTRSSGTSSRSNNGSCFSFSPPPAPGQQSSGIIPRGPGLLERLSRVPELGPRAPWRRLGGRETQQWGFAFRQGGLPLKLEEGIPEGPLKEMADLIRVRLGWVPDQLLVNRYGRGVGIAPHTDQRALGPTVATVSLLSDTVMEWEKGGRKVRTPLPVGTLCHMEGEARCLWTHGIRPADVTQPRVSLTYRSVRGGARSLSHDPPQPSADAPSHPSVGAPRTKRPTDRAQGLLPGKPGRNEEEEHDQGGATDAERDQGRPPQREERDWDAPPRAPPASLAPQPREARPWRWEDEWGPEWVPGDAPLARGRPARLPKTGGTKGGDRRRSPLPTYPPKPRPKKLRPTPSKEERRVKAGRRREARAKRREEEGQQPRSPSPAPRKEDEGDPPTTKGRWWARNKRRREGGRRKTRPHKKRREGLRRPAPPEEDEETPVSARFLWPRPAPPAPPQSWLGRGVGGLLAWMAVAAAMLVELAAVVGGASVLGGSLWFLAVRHGWAGTTALGVPYVQTGATALALSALALAALKPKRREPGQPVERATPGHREPGHTPPTQKATPRKSPSPVHPAPPSTVSGGGKFRGPPVGRGGTAWGTGEAQRAARSVRSVEKKPGSLPWASAAAPAVTAGARFLQWSLLRPSSSTCFGGPLPSRRQAVEVAEMGLQTWPHMAQRLQWASLVATTSALLRLRRREATPADTADQRQRRRRRERGALRTKTPTVPITGGAPVLLGPHELAGGAEPPKDQGPKPCPVNGCTEKGKRTFMTGHLSEHLTAVWGEAKAKKAVLKAIEENRYRRCQHCGLVVDASRGETRHASCSGKLLSVADDPHHQPDDILEADRRSQRGRIAKQVGAKILDTSGAGGDCGYRAINYARLKVEDANGLRKEVGAHIRQDFDTYTRILASPEEARAFALEVESSKKWMDMLTLQAISEMWAVCILVIRGGDIPVIRIGKETNDPRRVLVVAFGNGHYEKVRIDSDGKEKLWKMATKAVVGRLRGSPATAPTIEGTTGADDIRKTIPVPESYLRQLGLRGCSVCGDVVLYSQETHADCRKKLERPGEDPERPLLLDPKGSLPQWKEIAQLRVRMFDKVPRPVQRLWAETYVRTLRRAVDKNDESSYRLLYMLPKACLRKAPGAGGKRNHKRHANDVKSRLQAWNEGEYGFLWSEAVESVRNSPHKKKERELQEVEDERLARATVLAKLGRYSQGNKALTAKGLAEDNEETWKALESKHPKAAAAYDQVDYGETEEALEVTPENVLRCIRGFPRGSGAGPSAFKAQYIRDAVEAPDVEGAIAATTEFVNLLLSGRGPELARGDMAGATLIALRKKEKDVRPIAVGE
ncbi:tRNA (carboxymethyluridine(34)-5-O)-methyltransferase, partial [Diplonema papillatum]